MIARSSWVGLLLIALAGCGGSVADLYTCASPDRDHVGPDGEPDPCHYQAAAPDAGPQCTSGDFAHWSLPWQSPTLLWFGPPDQVPECPLGPATIAYEGRADLVAPLACDECTCEPPTGSCALPSKLTASNGICGAQGALTSFNAPDPWDGQCDSTSQTPDGAAHSLTIDPITMSENGCAPGPPVAAKVTSPRWDTFARACDVNLLNGGVDRSICLNDVDVPAGFALCVFRDGDNDCPDEPGNVFTQRHVFYKGVQDDRQCSACTCGAPTGSACTAMLSIFKGADLTCSGPVLAQTTISSKSPTCLDIQLPGQALGSKSAGPTTYLPGMCPSLGGDPSGTATATKPSTLCCRP